MAVHRMKMRAPPGHRHVAQSMIAKWAGYPNCQGQVSKIERGRLPLDPIEQANWARAYQLTVKAFVRLVEASRGWEALPLWQFAKVETPQYSVNLGAPAGTIVRAQA